MSRGLRHFLVLCFLVASSLAAAQIGAPLDVQGNIFVPNNRWALVVGVANYDKSVGALRYTAKEAKDFADTLKSDLAFAPENVRLLADGGQSDVAPTSPNILAALDSLLSDKRLDKANLFVFYFSGHGVGTPKGDFLLPADALKGEFETKGVPVGEVIRRIVGAGLKNVLFIADACRAGSENDFGEDLTELCHKSNIAVILGCAPGKRSYEYPELKQGAFTHFLLEGLKRPELRDISGALWASRLGADLQTRVHDFTEPDHGKYAQTPALWGEQSTLDVLLAAYPKPPVSDEAVRQFRAKAATLSTEDYAAAMIAYAYALYENDRTDETVEMLKTVDALGQLTPQARVTLAVALDTLGRTGEAQRVYATFDHLPDSVWRDIGLATSTSRALSPVERLRAAERLFATGGSWETKFLAIGIFKNWGTYEQKLRYAKLFASEDATPRRRLYAAALLANVEGRWADASKAFSESLKSPGASPSDTVIFTESLAPLRIQGNAKAYAALLDRGIATGIATGLCYLERAQLAKDANDPATRVAALKAALEADLSPTLMLRAASIAGPYIGMLKEAFMAAAEKHPYSWRARMVKYFVNEISGDKKAMEQDGYATDRYMDDRLTVYSSLFEFMDGFMTEAVLMGRMDPKVYRSQLDFYFLMMRDYSGGFGIDADLWMQLVKYGMFNERNGQVQQIVAKRLPLPAGSMPKNLKPMMFLLAANRGDASTAKALGVSAFEPTERTDPQWFYACYEATLGLSKEAASRIAGLAAPSAEIAEPMEALKTYLLAANGRVAEARKRLGKKSTSVVVDALDGMTWARLGDWKRAEPLLARQAVEVSWAFLFLQEYAVRILDARYRATGRLALARDLANFASISQPGNPLFDRYSYAANPGIPQFAGSVTLKGGTLDDKDPNETGTLTFSVSAAGSFTGTFKSDGGQGAKLQGAVDKFGNVRGTAAFHGKRYRLTGKIAPPALYGKLPKLHTNGQALQLIDDEGFRVFLVGRI